MSATTSRLVHGLVRRLASPTGTPRCRSDARSPAPASGSPAADAPACARTSPSWFRMAEELITDAHRMTWTGSGRARGSWRAANGSAPTSPACSVCSSPSPSACSPSKSSSRGEFKRKAMGAQAGALFGYVGKRVLGQYDVFLPPDDEGLLYFVGSQRRRGGAAVRAAAARFPACGSRSTRSRTGCSSARLRGCAAHLQGLVDQYLAAASRSTAGADGTAQASGRGGARRRRRAHGRHLPVAHARSSASCSRRCRG